MNRTETLAAIAALRIPSAEMPRSMSLIARAWEAVGSTDFWIAGGAIRASLARERVKDFDLFSPNPEALFAHLKGSQDFDLTNESERVCDFKHSMGRFQVIRAFPFATPEETIAAFDFTIACAAFDGDDLVAHERFFMDVAAKALVVNALPFPLSSMQRALRFTGRGYRLCPVGLATLLKAINQTTVDWDSPDENSIEFYPDGTPRFHGWD